MFQNVIKAKEAEDSDLVLSLSTNRGRHSAASVNIDTPIRDGFLDIFSILLLILVACHLISINNYPIPV